VRTGLCGSAGPFKSREELEVQVSDAETTARMLEQLGFVQILRYEKRRESWQLDPCRVELDEPPRIGLFVEIEGPDEDSIRQVQKKIGLGDAQHVKASYVAMLAAYCDEHDVHSRVLEL
jgi:predicted adenylyl cyclase CyaB